MHNYVYLLLNLGAILPILLLSLLKWRGVWVKKNILASFLLISLPFVIWDFFATKTGYWSFSETYTIGLKVAGLPLEEILFFFAIPFACMYVWECFVRFQKDSKINSVLQRFLTAGLSVFAAVLLVYGGWYSRTIAILLFASVIILDRLGWLRRKRFWSFQICLLLLFFAFNTVLTMLPIVSYGSDFITGLRIGTIPLEDFAYNFVLINMSLVVYDYFAVQARR